MINIIVIFFAILLLIAYYVARYIVNANVHTKEQSRYHYEQSEFADYQKEDFRYINKEGNSLIGLLFRQEKSRGLIILAHGFGTNHFFMAKHAQLFLRIGFDTLLYSHVHADNYHSKKCGMGGFESDDLDELVQRFKAEYNIVGTYGISMGGATALLHSAKYESADFCISESAYASMYSELRFKFRRKMPGLGWILLPLTRFFIWLLGGYDIKNIQISKALEKCNTPIMIIHGSLDPTVHIEDGLQIARQAKNCKRLYICNGAKHTNSLALQPQRYQKEVETFLTELEK